MDNRYNSGTPDERNIPPITPPGSPNPCPEVRVPVRATVRPVVRPPMPEVDDDEPKEKGKIGIIFLLLGTLILSGALGFAGGFFASYFNGNGSGIGRENEVVKEVIRERADISLEQIEAADSSAFNAAAVAAVNLESVVEITTETVVRSNSIMGQYVTTGAGSGVIISEDGYIVTNHHVISGATKITVRTYDGGEYNASIVGMDEITDLAVIKVETKNLRAAEYGASANLVVGQRVLAIGNPLGELGGTVTEGIISALDREVQIEGQNMTLLQTDASVNPGNSGGGLFDGNGKLIGIVNAKSSGSGIEGLGFAIPVDTARKIIDDLIENGYVSGRPELGIQPTYISEQAAYLYRMDGAGVYVAVVSKDSAAEKAGMMKGDRILALNGVEITSTDQLGKEIRKYKAGDEVSCEIVRGGKQIKLKVILGEKQPETPLS